MEDKTLLRIALIVSLLGLIIIYLLFQNLSQPISEEKLDQLPEKSWLKVRGEIKEIKEGEKVSFLKLSYQNPEEIDIVLFKGKNSALKKGDIIEIEGNIETYKDKKQLVASQVTLINKEPSLEKNDLDEEVFPPED